MEFTGLKQQYDLLRNDINAGIQRVLDHGQYIMGPEVAQLEAQLAEYCGARHCITVSSGTEALLISLMALGVQPGDEVITTPFSFIATAEAIVLAGARPVFVDVERATGNLDPARIGRRIGARTRAIMPVSLYGQPADMDAINDIARRHGLAVIEDGAQSFGASYPGQTGGQRSGNLSTIGCTSFFPSKPLGCYGDGGAIFTSDDELARAMREIRIHGQAERYRHTRVGVGGRMDTLQCAVVLAKLPTFDDEIAARRRVAAAYDRCFGSRVETLGGGKASAWAQYTIVPPRRQPVQAALTAAGIPSVVHYPQPIHLQPAYLRYDDVSCPVAELLAGRVLSLPMGPHLSQADVARVAATVLAGLDA
ncbi:DegT/DnrJ/EryC1/StrS family aminotransferase [Duganella phyllosphaerae]|uniref:UDP-2-acetamido-2-deoxy-3-oxo-D-glucuronate aminotransferase n=1 Tax=Duganella phyllosphaerae TaxID=762836 RepID=A0A1E7X8B7_9BURK|nr:DegT/DnrJ/EryC1/StrS family aminotransferase [Duganella phyllosphaerae]OFA09248.1 UDP-2-acetamido-2-deoxy-3-oxo-D-glucuronate aminotransferase [Duganella phyllosphaerae]